MGEEIREDCRKCHLSGAHLACMRQSQRTQEREFAAKELEVDLRKETQVS